MTEKIWKAQLEQMHHLIVKASDYQRFRTWLSKTEYQVLNHLNVQDSLIRELTSIELPNHQEKSQAFEQRQLLWKNKVAEGYGNWVYYPWNQSLIWLPEEHEFILIRTSRNKHLITEEEQQLLLKASIGIVGLSVGHSIASALAMECCGGELRLADFDSLDLSNLNRIRASVLQLGHPKTQIVFRTLAEINPYLKLKIWDQGLSELNVDEFLNGLDLVIEECDSLDIKVLTRERARNWGIPVIMETADRGMMDIERFDLEPHRPIFHGMAGSLTVEQLKGLNTEQKVPYVLPLVGGEKLSARMKASMLEINRTIKSWPQLGAQVQMGAGLCADLARKILLNQITTSGRYYFDVENTISTNQSTWLVAHESIEAPTHFEDHQACQEHALNALDSAELPLPVDSLLIEWINQACLAPTGGNLQHWWWIRKGNTLFLYEDASRSFSFLNFQGSGANFGFGAALENLQLAAHHSGFQLHIDTFPDPDFKPCIAKIWVSKASILNESKELETLYDAFKIRCTDRGSQGKLPQNVEVIFESLNQLIDANDFQLKYLTETDQLEEVAQEVGLADRLRLLNPQAHFDFINELRWTDEENKKKNDGIDLATCYLKPSDLAVLQIAKDRKAFDFLEQQQLGMGLGELTAKLVKETPALGLLVSKSDDSQGFLKAGALTQRIWLSLNQKGISFQPVSPITFLYLRNRNSGIDLKPWQRTLLTKSEEKFKHIWNLHEDEHPMFLFRFFTLPHLPKKSLRRPIEEVYTNLLQV